MKCSTSQFIYFFYNSESALARDAVMFCCAQTLSSMRLDSTLSTSSINCQIALRRFGLLGGFVDVRWRMRGKAKATGINVSRTGKDVRVGVGAGGAASLTRVQQSNFI